MQIEITKSFDDYISSGDETTRELLARGGPLVDAARSYYEFFAGSLWAGGVDIYPVPAVVATNAFMLYLGGTRIALTGHVAAIFPVLRAALESACYAFLMTRDPSLETVWVDRHRNERSRALCRQKFAGAVRATVDGLNTIQPESGNWIMEAYESAIDYGAHPNPRSVLRHLRFGEAKANGFQRVNLTALYASDAHEVAAALVACLDYGLAVSIVLCRCRRELPPITAAHLFELNELKERAAADLMAD